MLYYFDINTYIITTVSGVSNTLMRCATLRLQLVILIFAMLQVEHLHVVLQHIKLKLVTVIFEILIPIKLPT